MYESFFALSRRPFAATPDPDAFVPVASAREVLEELAETISGGRGIAVLTAPAGMGKTVLAQTLRRRLSDEFITVFLPNSNYSTRRSLLQAVLFELGQPYSKLPEQELWLELTDAARQSVRDRGGLVLIVDEAHLLSARLLEELRAITNLTADGRSLVRLVLCGQLPLEDKLAEPGLEALNQRVGCQLSLPPLSPSESQEYLAARLKRAGAELDETFTADGRQLIGRAADGVPRCLNQLADHALLLGCALGTRPLTVEIVRSALEDLKQLPLNWNAPLEAQDAAASAPDEHPVETAHYEDSTEGFLAGSNGSETEIPADVCEPVEFAAVEFGAPLDDKPMKGSDPFAGQPSPQVLHRSPAKGSDPVREPSPLAHSPFLDDLYGDDDDHSPPRKQGTSQTSLPKSLAGASGFLGSKPGEDEEDVHVQGGVELSLNDETLCRFECTLSDASPALREPHDIPAPHFTDIEASHVEEIEVIDRYALIDAGLPLPAGLLDDVRFGMSQAWPGEDGRAGAVRLPIHRETPGDASSHKTLSAMGASLDAIIAADAFDVIEPPGDALQIPAGPALIGETDVGESLEADIASLVLDTCFETQEFVGRTVDVPAEYDVVEPEEDWDSQRDRAAKRPAVAATPTAAAGAPVVDTSEAPARRRYARLFSELRRRRNGRA
ncbi:MAG: AAA family ATPase [Planctomycetes bacterium]|nr:AAA family ATPase [Planctomycetota bacterium]